MAAEVAFVDKALAAVAITNLIGDRLYPVLIPQEATLPATAYQRTGSERDLAHDGPVGMATAELLVTHVAKDYPTVKSLASAFRVEFNGFAGTVGSVEVEYCNLDEEEDGYGEQQRAFTIRQDYTILYQE